MYIDQHIFVPNRGPNHKTGAPAKPVNELYVSVLSEVSSLSRVSDVLQKSRRILDCDWRPFDLLVLAVEYDDRRLPDLQSQPVGSVGVNNVKQVVD